MLPGEQELYHYGTPRHSGRYPWGSGKDPYQRASNFISEVKSLKKQGLTEKQIAEHFEMNTTQLRARLADTKSYKRQEDIAMARRLREKGMSPKAISERMEMPETTVRNLLKPDADAKATKLENTRDILKKNVEDLKYVDCGKGVEQIVGCSSTQLNQAVQMLKDEGYEVRNVYIRQLGLSGDHQFTETKVLCPPGTTAAELQANRGKIRIPFAAVDEKGILTGGIMKPVSIDPKRVSIRYAEDGGTDMDGVIELRRGLKDTSLGSSHYAQVRIAVGDTHYIKGMAIYSDDLPKGVDFRFNTNKKKGTPMMGDKDDTVLKPMKYDGLGNNPFGAVIRQSYYTDKNGKKKLSPLNIVNEEGDWDNWSRSLASQMLSKQRASEAKKQLKVTRDKLQAEYDDIMKMTNPLVRQKLLISLADRADSKAVDLKAAAYPRQSQHVILPLKGIKPNEIYAPNFKNGEKVALIRYPHGGTFEIPELTVNNNSRSGIRVMGKKALDAVGIHPSVAGRLSGADFDGDSVVVIPNNDGKVKSSPALRGLKGFEPKDMYAYTPGMKVMKKGAETQTQMGRISNLITDMTIKGATADELARAVRHSMVVIDAAKHRLNYKQSEIDNDIPALKKKYQGKTNGGAATLISRAKSEVRIDQIRERPAKDGGPINPKTGERVYIKTGATRKKDWRDPNSPDIPLQSTIKKMEYYKDARSLISDKGTVIEHIYADHANSMKALANKARKEAIGITPTPYDPKARVKYANEVASLKGKLTEAYKRKPLERQAQVLANSVVQQQMSKYPDMSDDEIAKAKRVAIADARAKMRTSKYKMEISDREWQAIQSGAIRTNMMREIISVTPADRLAELSMPRSKPALSTSQKTRAKAMLKNHTIAEVAEALGVSTSTVKAVMQDG